MSENRAVRWLAAHGYGVADIGCVELAGEVIEANGQAGGRLAYLEPATNLGALCPAFAGGYPIWLHHAVAVLDGLVHDPWHGCVVPLEEWVKMAFPCQSVRVSYPADTFAASAAPAGRE